MNPPITLILPTLNEKAHIRECLDSLLGQDYDNIVSILVIDGGSTDGTREIVNAEGGIVRLIENPRVTAAAAMNIGIAECATDRFVRVDAHTLYATDYVSRSVATWLETNAEVVGGPMRPVGTTPFGKAVAAVTTSPLGVGPGRFHYSEKLEEVETVYLGIFDKAFVQKVGGYDETTLQWAAEDQELNFRIRKAGGRIILDPRIRSTYFPRSTPKALARQYHNYGMCKASTLKKHRVLPYWRPLAPALLVSTSLLWISVFATSGHLTWALLPICIYLSLATIVGTVVGGRSLNSILLTAEAITICHWSYGLGFIRGVIRILLGKPFDSIPKIKS